tara:strand:+ start:2046 stop:2642 length:597 start_codon:yes stop_codon:yes gene_type:complete
MSLTVKKKGDDFQQVSPGTHPAICNAVIDLGYQDGPYGIKHQAILRFELPTELIDRGDEKGKPMVMSAFYNASLNEKATLRRDLEGWRGRAFTPEEEAAFDLKNVLGAACTLGVFHNENGKARIKSISPAMKGQNYQLANKPIWFDLDHHDENSSEFQSVPEWIQKIIGERVKDDSPGDAYEQAGPDVGDGFDDDIPF